MPEIILTGIKPTGTPHLGNYVAAIAPALRLAEESNAALGLFFIADYHALTSEHDATRLDAQSKEVAATWLAAGLDTEQNIFYRQSRIPETFELHWILSCFTPKGLMNRAHAYKAAVAQNVEKGLSEQDKGINVGLFNYPILMSADILLFDADTVPVGQDQVQHVEIAREIAGKFNHNYRKQILHLPKAQVLKSVAAIPGLDGRKMSKSYKNTIPLFAPKEKLRKLIFGIVTDSKTPTEPKETEGSVLFALYQSFAQPESTERLRTAYAEGISWADVKQATFELIDSLVSEKRDRYNYLLSHTDEVEQILLTGEAKARVRAKATLARVREVVGIRGAGFE
jgi:tryptophanyl-tRNA synthetase